MKTKIQLLFLAFSLGISQFCAQSIMNIHQNNGTVLQIPLNTIDSITYTISDPGSLATLTTSLVLNITENTAETGGIISHNGGTPVTHRGVCWSTSPNPTTANYITTDGAGIGSFTSYLNDLTASTTYYVRAYAINSAGIAYGNEIMFTTNDYLVLNVGDLYQGGMVAYLLNPSDPGYDPTTPHGIIAALYDQSSGAEWGCMGTLIGSSSDDGQSNTSLIISGCGSPNIAARICANLVIDGYDDWYLPSFTELYTLYEALYLNGNPGNFQPANYWSSREDGENFAYPYEFSTGFYYSTQKSVQYRVRAIRKF